MFFILSILFILLIYYSMWLVRPEERIDELGNSWISETVINWSIADLCTVIFLNENRWMSVLWISCWKFYEYDVWGKSRRKWHYKHAFVVIIFDWKMSWKIHREHTVLALSTGLKWHFFFKYGLGNSIFAQKTPNKPQSFLFCGPLSNHPRLPFRQVWIV